MIREGWQYASRARASLGASLQPAATWLNPLATNERSVPVLLEEESRQNRQSFP